MTIQSQPPKGSIQMSRLRSILSHTGRCSSCLAKPPCHQTLDRSCSRCRWFYPCCTIDKIRHNLASVHHRYNRSGHPCLPRWNPRLPACYRLEINSSRNHPLHHHSKRSNKGNELQELHLNNRHECQRRDPIGCKNDPTHPPPNSYC